MSKRRLEDGEGVYLRTRKRAKATEYKGKATVQDLPTEILWKIIDYLDDESFFNLQNMGPTISKALTVVFYHHYNTIPTRIDAVRKRLYDKLYSSSLDEETKRLDITKSLLYLDWMETELVGFEGILRRYNIDSESTLFPQLWLILKEMLGRVDSLLNCVPFSDFLADVRVMNPSTSLPLWTKFIEQFDQELEPTLGRSFPFETRVVDILSCCPSTNVDVIVNRSQKDDTVGLKAFFQIQDACSERYRPEIVGDSDTDYEKAILRFLRFTVRTRNSLVTSSLYDDIKNLECRLLSIFMNEVDRNKVVILLEDRYRRLESSFYEPLLSLEDQNNGVKYFIRRSTYNVSNNFLECILEKSSLSPGEIPLIAVYPHLFKVTKREYSSDPTNKCSCISTTNLNEPSFKFTVVYKRWWQDINILITRTPVLDNSLISFTVAESVETCQRANNEQ